MASLTVAAPHASLLAPFQDLIADEVNVKRVVLTEANISNGDIGVAGPSGTEDGIGAIGFEPLVHAGACDLQFQFHLRERLAHRCSLGIIPIAVVGRLPVALKRLRGRSQ